MPVNSTQELFPGDLVVSIDGVPMEQIGNFQVQNQIPGEIGKRLKVTVRRVTSKPEYVTFYGQLEVEGPDQPSLSSSENEEPSSKDLITVNSASNGMVLSKCYSSLC